MRVAHRVKIGSRLGLVCFFVGLCLIVGDLSATNLERQKSNEEGQQERDGSQRDHSENHENHVYTIEYAPPDIADALNAYDGDEKQEGILNINGVDADRENSLDQSQNSQPIVDRSIDLSDTGINQDAEDRVLQPSRDAPHLIESYMREGYRFKFGEDGSNVDVPAAMTAFDKAAGLNHPSAFTELGILFSTMLGDVDRGVEYFHRAADLGDPAAKAILARRYGFGLGVPIDCEKAYGYYLEVGDYVLEDVILAQRDTDMFHIHPSFRNDQQFTSEQEVAWDHYNSRNGHTGSAFRMARRLMFGEDGVDENPQQAHDHYVEQAELGDAATDANLGFMYLYGVGVPENHSLALHYFNKSAQSNHPSGINGLGIMYRRGLGVPENITKSFEYFEAAAQLDNVDGLFNTGLMYRYGTGVPKDSEKAFHYIKRAVEVGNYKAPYSLGVMHHDGEGTEQSCPAALDALVTIANKGPWVKYVEKGYERYREGEYEKALMYYSHVTEFGLYTPTMNLAYLYNKFAHHISSEIEYSTTRSQLQIASTNEPIEYYQAISEENRIALSHREVGNALGVLDAGLISPQDIKDGLLRRACKLYEDMLWKRSAEVNLLLGKTEVENTSNPEKRLFPCDIKVNSIKLLCISFSFFSLG
eukprot:TRINITY_DN2899_c0_g1_i2.p1 TRINITY_DN2899_c0_g1~~TRINITY_DN2899_c0_g1_i2.p1  ORF type:complete len:644 (+),score=124.49 TRINITY_DN2899_c0_g1_i2:48-1979(+)